MNDTEFENFIRHSLQTCVTPSRESFGRVLSKLTDETVTESVQIRYTEQTTPSNIISTFIQSFRSTRLVLVPSLILVLIVGGLSLHAGNTNASTRAIERLADENETTIEEPGIDLDDSILTSFDTPAMNELTTNQNETRF